jgi:uncharacterized membrane protein YedE/YeeE
MKASFLELDLEISKRTDIDKSLIIGSALFGIGWGMVGYCPAPAVTSLFFGNIQTFLFVGSMIAGIYLFKLIKKCPSKLLNFFCKIYFYITIYSCNINSMFYWKRVI